MFYVSGNRCDFFGLGSKEVGWEVVNYVGGGKVK